MRGTTLAAEYKTALGATQMEHLRPLLIVGVSAATIANVMPAFLRITVAGTTYQPDPAGNSAYVLPVRLANPLTPEAVDPLKTVGALARRLAELPRAGRQQ